MCCSHAEITDENFFIRNHITRSMKIFLKVPKSTILISYCDCWPLFPHILCFSFLLWFLFSKNFLLFLITRVYRGSFGLKKIGGSNLGKLKSREGGKRILKISEKKTLGRRSLLGKELVGRERILGEGGVKVEENSGVWSGPWSPYCVGK